MKLLTDHLRILEAGESNMEAMDSEINSRRILSKEHNKYMSEGIDRHKATRLVPSILLKSFDEELEERIKAQHESVHSTLVQCIGNPFFSDVGFILFHGDCLELLGGIQGNEISVDLTVTSPPYNIGKEYEKPVSVDEYISWCSKWIREIYEITSSNGAFWLNVGYLEIPGKGLCIPIPYLLWDKSPFFFLQEIVWAYGAGVSAKRRLSPRNEKWLFYVKNPKDYTFNLDDIRDPNVKYPFQKKNGKFRCNPLGKNPSDVWELPKVTTGKDRSSRERTDHPAQFPLAVVERIITASSNLANVVLDPFAGSCSAGIAAAGLGRVFVGFEIRLDYCRLAAKRFKEFKEQRQNARRQAALF